jgi:hypothetical protein
MEYLKYLGAMVMVFLNGGIAMVNWGGIVGRNDAYVYSWSKVVMALLFAVFWSVVGWLFVTRLRRR